MAECGDVVGVEELLTENPSLVHSLNDDGDQPLHIACWQKQIGIIGALMAFGPDVNCKGCYSRTPLHYAVHEGRAISVGIVSMLLQEGADTSLRDDHGFTAADWAKVEMTEGLQEVLKLIHDHQSS